MIIITIFINPIINGLIIIISLYIYIIIIIHIHIHCREHLLIEWVKLVSELELDIKYPEITQLVQHTIDIVPSTRDFSNMLSNPAIIVKNR